MISLTNIHMITAIAFCCCYMTCLAKDILTMGEIIKDGFDFLESPGKTFQMGFFPREKTSEEVRRYLGIWYTMDPKTVVWVANRDHPVSDKTGFLIVSEDGKAKVLDKQKNVYFSTTKEGGDPSSALKLLDNGNAVLLNVDSGIILWQSFENPTDTILPGMIMDAKTLTSWKSPVDPGSGSFSFQKESGDKRYSILNGSITYHWLSGKMSKDSFDKNQIFTKAFSMLSNITTQTRTIILSNRTRYNETYMVIERYSRLVMNYSGNIQYFSWSTGKNKWNVDWQEPKNNCSIYRRCGVFGLCYNDSMCKCLSGFESKSLGDPTAGCQRTSKICDKSIKETFLNITMISVDDTTLRFYKSDNESSCMKKCLEDCACLAYSYSSQNEEGTWDKSRDNTQSGCWFWNSEPVNLQENGTRNISFRVSESSKGHNISIPLDKQNPKRKSSFRKRLQTMVIVVSAVVLSSFCIISYIYYKKSVNRRKNSQDNIDIQSNNTRRRINDLLHLDHSKDDERDDEREGIDVPYFELESIIAATDDFSENNRLGQGGFGPVYKGKLPRGQEIAVKRLSSLSGQGLEEFKNEVILIAKLQHRNLVRLLGYCVRGEEKMLLYEYMPNRSLDLFIFDRTMCTSLNWEMRFNIIMGISRGLNYLHHDSRLRIIHRDLKTSNILLDEDMNPKISDFGLAKIVKGKDLEATTDRVIGTFGYMSPEYALDGLFSIKSDVFSFGVVMLEIVSGKKNTGFYQSQKTTSLLEHAWSLWLEDKPFELMDHILMDSCNSSEVLKCIIIGLLCVQGDPDDRPTMTNVVLMLGGDIATLAVPKEPAFITRRDNASSSYSSSSKPDTETKNMITMTDLAGR